MPEPEANAKEVGVAIADEVAAVIKAEQEAGEYGLQFTVERNYADWDLELSKAENATMRESEKIRVDVVPHTTERRVDMASQRTKVTLVVPVDIAIRKKFGNDSVDAVTGRVKLADVDALMLLTQRLLLRFMPQRLTEFPYAVFDGENGGTSPVAFPVKQHLYEMKQFTGIIRVVFRADVALNG